MIKTIAGYVRVSTEMQAERDSVIVQDDSITTFAEKKPQPLRIYKDIGISAKDQKRPGFQELIDDIKQGKICMVVVTKLDRITRSLKDLIFLKDLFEEYDVAFVALTQNLDTSTPMGRFSFYVLGLVSQLEREVTAERVAEVMRARARKLKWNGGIIPFGFTSQKRVYEGWLLQHGNGKSNGNGQLDGTKSDVENSNELDRQAKAYAQSIVPKPKELIVDPEEAEVIRLLFGLYLKHKSFRQVTHRVNASDLKTRNGVAWASTTIKRILQNPMYYGALTYNKRQAKGSTSKPRPVEEHIVIDGVYEPIISKEIFEQVQEIIKEQKQIPARAKSTNYLLTGLVKCGICQSNMYGYTMDDSRRKPGRIYQYYRCNGHIQKGNHICPGNTIDLKYLDQIIVDELKSFKINPIKLKDEVKQHNLQYDQESVTSKMRSQDLKVKIEKIDRKISRLFSLYEDEMIQKQEFHQRKQILDEQKRILQQEVDEINHRLQLTDMKSIDLDSTLSSLENLADVYDEIDFPEKKELLRTVVSDIVVDETGVDLNIYALSPNVVTRDCTGVPAAT